MTLGSGLLSVLFLHCALKPLAAAAQSPASVRTAPALLVEWKQTNVTSGTQRPFAILTCLLGSKSLTPLYKIQENDDM